MKLARFLLTASAAILAPCSLLDAAEPASPLKGRPNILIFLADDLGYGELSCQGFTKEVPTPNIDSIAANGVRFTNGYVSGPYCSPTRAGLMTGRYQQRFGHEFNPGPAESVVPNFGLPVNEKTLGNCLKTAGYTNGWFGKSHLGYKPEFHPLKRGFDEFFGFLGGSHDYLDASGDPDNPILRGTEPVEEETYTTEAFAREAAAFIEKHHAKPWFCYLAFNAVHAPLQATDKYLARFPGVTNPRRKVFCGMLSAMDDAVGSVLAKVREHKLEENTLIVFLSDNGGPTTSTTSSNGPLRGFKSQTWEGGIRVPFMMQWKTMIAPGQVDQRPVIQLDLLPTALAAAGVEVQKIWQIDGKNLLPYVTGADLGAPHQALYWRFGQQVAIRSADWKLLKAAGMADIQVEANAKASMEGAALYHLPTDIGENTNVAAKYPEKVKQLATLWDDWNVELMDPKWVPARNVVGGKKNEMGKKPAAE